MTEEQIRKTRSDIAHEYSMFKSDKNDLSVQYNKLLAKSKATSIELEQLKAKKKELFFPEQFISILTGYAFATKQDKMHGYRVIKEACQWHNEGYEDIDQRISQCKQSLVDYRRRIMEMSINMDMLDKAITDCRKKLKELK